MGYMTEIMNKVIFKLPPTLGVLNSLPLTDNLKVILSPFAKGIVILVDEAGGWITAKVNKQATFLKGPNLVDFLEAQVYSRLELSHMEGNHFRVTPSRETPESIQEKTATQLSLGFSTEEHHTRKSISAQEKNNTEHTRTEKDRKVAPTKSSLKEKDRAKVLTKSTSGAVVKKPLQPISIPVELPSIPAPQPAITLTPLVVNSLVNVVFHTEEDTQVLQSVKAGQFTPTTDYYLRQQALQLSVSPGFETLMSLQAARLLQPLDYQLRTVRHVLMNLRGRALLCDEVGMGKTIEAGLITLEYILRGLVRRVLVLSPPSLVEQWQEEMRSKFNLDFVVYDSAEFKAQPNPWATFPLIIASIDTAKRGSKQEQILAVPYDLVIVDEAHHLKKQRSQAYQLVSQLKNC